MTAYLVTAPLVIAKDAEGKLHHCYEGAVIPWLSIEQRDAWLRLKLIEELNGQTTPTAPCPTIPTYRDIEYATPNGDEQTLSMDWPW
jgi:hypothetical protein